MATLIAPHAAHPEACPALDPAAPSPFARPASGRPAIAPSAASRAIGQRPTVVVLSGDPDARRIRAAALAATGLRVLAVATVQAARLAATDGASCLVVDRRVPDGDALALVDELYRSGRPLRIVVVTTAESAEERVESLVAGADDVVPPEVPTIELVVRVRRLAAPAPQAAPARPPRRLVVGRLAIDLDRRSVRVDGTEVALSPTQYQILVSLVVERGRAVAARTLVERCWDSHRDQASCAVRTQVTRLRSALGGAVVIRCVRGEGYRLAAPED